MNETRKLAQFVASKNYQDLPAKVIYNLKSYVLDNIAAGFVGSLQSWSTIVADLVQDQGGKNESSIFNKSWKIDASRATLINGTMIGAFELEHIAYAAHPSGTVFPAALAVAERDNLSGKKFITALALGYEVNCRVAQAQTNAAESERGFHNPSINGVFGSAVAVSKLVNLDEQEILNSLGIAGSHSAGVIEFAWEGSMTKRIHLGRASQLGLESALLAQRGFSGPSTILEGTYGYLQAFSPKPMIHKLLEGLGEDWLLLKIIIKSFACHLSSQGIVRQIQDYRYTHNIDPNVISKISILANPHFTEGRFSNQYPDNILGAQYSMPFTVAMAMLHDMSNPMIYNETILVDSRVRGLSGKIEIKPDSRFDRYQYDAGAEITVEYVNGDIDTLKVNDFVGSLRKPMSFGNVEEKFLRVTKKIIDKKTAALIIDKVQNLEKLESVKELTNFIGEVY